MRIKRMWKPKIGERYYIPATYPLTYDTDIWHGNSLEEECYEHGLIVKTIEEAEELSEKISELLLEERRTKICL